MSESEEALREGWREMMDQQGRKYYQNDETRETQWHPPLPGIPDDAMSVINQMLHQRSVPTSTPDGITSSLPLPIRMPTEVQNLRPSSPGVRNVTLPSDGQQHEVAVTCGADGLLGITFVMESRERVRQHPRPLQIESILQGAPPTMLRRGDFVHAIDGNTIEDLDYAEIASILRGTPGKSFSFTVSRSASTSREQSRPPPYSGAVLPPPPYNPETEVSIRRQGDDIASMNDVVVSVQVSNFHMRFECHRMS